MHSDGTHSALQIRHKSKYRIIAGGHERANLHGCNGVGVGLVRVLVLVRGGAVACLSLYRSVQCLFFFFLPTFSCTVGV